MYYKSVYDSPIGKLYILTDEAVLTELRFENDRHPGKNFRDAVADQSTAIMQETRVWLDRYFAGLAPSPYELRMSAMGTEFRMRIWDILKSIPYGRVITYGDVADIYCRELGIKQMSAQAVGGAVGHNPIGIIIPCHRVIGADNGMTGFGGGIDNKIWLLKHEGHDSDLKYTHTGDYYHQ